MTNKLIIRPGTFIAATFVSLVMVFLLIMLGSTGLSEEKTYPKPSLPSLDSGTIKGSMDASIIILEFSDFQCYFCQEFANTTLRKLERTYIATGKVRLRYLHYPVSGEESVLSALASECAAAQGQFWPYHDLLMATKASPDVTDLTRDSLENFARELGLDITQFNACLDSKLYQDKINQDYILGKELGIPGIPTFFINGIEMAGDQPFEVFQEVIEQLLGESVN